MTKQNKKQINKNIKTKQNKTKQNKTKQNKIVTTRAVMETMMIALKVYTIQKAIQT